MKRSASDRARQLATEIQRLFAQDTELAHKLTDAHHRLPDANECLWSGLQPDGLRVLHGDHRASEAGQLEASVHGRLQVLNSTDGLGAVQQVHCQIHRAHFDDQHLAKEGRRLAGDIAGVVRAFLDELIAAGWSEHGACTANLDKLARSPEDA